MSSTLTRLPAALIDWLQQHTHDHQLDAFNLIQPLWSDFGSLIRCFSPARQSTIIIKWICKPATFHHPRGWHTEASQQRKWQSYTVERNFYQQVASNQAYTIANLITQGNVDDGQCLVLCDLDTQGFVERPARLAIEQCEPVLAWLAAFHSFHLGQTSALLWKKGSYWQLDTRRDEWRSMQDGPLKTAAQQLHDALQACPYKTLIHGDAKLANFCFTTQLNDVAAVDFQYVGGGIGVQDVAYFLGSALSEADLLRHTEQALDIYFDYLFTYLSKQAITPREAHNICHQWRGLYDIASADFHRFLAGWSPQHTKINTALHHHTNRALRMLS